MVVHAKLWFMESSSLWKEKHQPLGPELDGGEVKIWLFLIRLGCLEAVGEAGSNHLHYHFNTAEKRNLAIEGDISAFPWLKTAPSQWKESC